jgi:hypothetical protein
MNTVIGSGAVFEVVNAKPDIGFFSTLHTCIMQAVSNIGELLACCKLYFRAMLENV